MEDTTMMPWFCSDPLAFRLDVPFIEEEPDALTFDEWESVGLARLLEATEWVDDLEGGMWLRWR